MKPLKAYSFLLLLLASCLTSKSSHVLYINNEHSLNIADSTYQKLELWKKDSNACLGIRDGMMSIELFNELQLKNYNYEEIRYILGNPNFIRESFMKENHEQNPKGPLYFDSTITLTYTLYKVCDTLVKPPYNQAGSYWWLLFSKKSKKFLRSGHGNIM